MTKSSLQHLQAHHGDFARFRDVMIDTSVGRFGPIWWGIWDQHVQPSPDATIVDLGSGPGLLLPMLRQRVPDGTLIGVEIQPEMISHARGVAESCNATLVEADLGNLPLPLEPGCADIVTMVMVFHELEFPPPLIEEAWRLLRSGGVLVLYDWVRRPLESYLQGEELTPDRLQHFREHCLFTADDLAFLCQQRGFQILERVDRRGGNFTILVVQKP